jgi:hypothetical protein
VSEPKVDCSSFTLPFMQDATELAVASGKHDEDGAALLSAKRLLRFLLAAVPADAIELGQVESLVSNWTTWRIDDHFYLLRTPDSDFEWALFRITYDDNFERYEWSGEARASGYADQAAALRAMLPATFKSWGLDLTQREHRPYRDFLAKHAGERAPETKS